MALASKWLDMVVGLDLHMEMVPTPVPTPTPIPHPFLGLIFDPVGMVMEEVVAAVMAWLSDAPPEPGKVWISGFRATVTGDEVVMPVPHILIPPGVAWAPIPRVPKPPVGLAGKLPAPAPPLPPPSDALLLMGAQFVKMMGANAVRVGEIALPCSDPVRMPTASVISTGMNGLVTVGGPPGIDWQQVTMLAGMRALRVSWSSEGSSGFAGAMAGGALPESLARARNIVPKSACYLTGHPVNVANGTVLTDAVDFELPGAIPVVFERNYNSNWFDRDSPVGFGWAHSLDQKIWLEDHCIVFLCHDGREVEFSTRGLPGGAMRSGDTLFDPVDRLTLRSHGQFRWTIRRPDGVVLEFGPIPGESTALGDRGMARLQQLRTPGGDSVQLAYNSAAQLASVTDCGGRIANFEHDARGRLSRIWLPAGNGSGVRQRAEFHYDADGNLIEARDSAGSPTTFGYDRRLLVSETNRNGLTFFFKYDGWGRFARCTETWGIDPAGDPAVGIYHHLLDYDRKGRRTVVTNSLGHITVYAYDGAFMVTKIVDSAGGETTLEYDAAHRLVAKVNALGQRTDTTYDDRGNTTMVVEPGKRITKFEYDDNDNIVAVVAPSRARWTWSYDNANRVISAVNPNGHATQYRYEQGRLAAVIDPSGARTAWTYDEAGNVAALTSANGSSQRWVHDALGRVTAYVDELGRTQRYTLDEDGRPLRTEEADGNVREFAYDAEGNLVRERDRNTDVCCTFRGLGKLATRTVAGTTVEYMYDTEERLIAIVNEGGERHEFELDELGEVRAEQGFGGSRQYRRDALGRITKVTGARHGTGYDAAYDEAGRVVAVEHAGGPSLAYRYNEDGLLLEAVANGSSTMFERDALGTVVLESADDAWIRSTPDHAGRRVAMQSSRGAKVEYVRDAQGNVAKAVCSAPGGTWDAVFTRDALGQEFDRQLPGGARSYWWRDETGLPTQHFVGKAEHSYRRRAYTWATGARLAQLEDEGRPAAAFKHDARGYLHSVEHLGGALELRNPDEIGRLFRSSDRSDRDYTPSGQLLRRTDATGSTAYEYDKAGNLAQRLDPNGGRWFFHYDGIGQLRQVDRPNGTAVSFRYDALGRRVEKNAGGTITRWQWDGDTPVHEWQESGEAPELIRTPQLARHRQGLLDLRATLRRKLGDAGEAQWLAKLRSEAEADFIAREVLRDADADGTDDVAPSAPDKGTGLETGLVTWIVEPDTFSPCARIASDSVLSIVTDHLGTPLCLLGPTGEVQAQANLDTYGNAVISGNAQLCPWRFPGQYEDAETGLFYNLLRYYDPAAGNYVTPDPIGLAGGLALYSYVKDPSTWIDPLGLSGSPGGCGGGAGAGINGPTQILLKRNGWGGEDPVRFTLPLQNSPPGPPTPAVPSSHAAPRHKVVSVRPRLAERLGPRARG